VSDKKSSKPLDAIVGAGIAAVVIMAATFGEFGPAHHATQAATYGAMQGSQRHQAFGVRTGHAKARCLGTAPCWP
jgi:hypothetical protein